MVMKSGAPLLSLLNLYIIMAIERSSGMSRALKCLVDQKNGDSLLQPTCYKGEASVKGITRWRVG